MRRHTPPARGGLRHSLDRIGTSMLLFVIVTGVLVHRQIADPAPDMASPEVRSSQRVAAVPRLDRAATPHVPPTPPDPAQGNLPEPSTHVDQAPVIRRGGDNQHVPAPPPRTLSAAELADFTPNELGHIPVLMYHAFTTNPDYLDDWTRTPDGFRDDLQWLYDHDFFIIGIGNVLANEIAVPPGKHPVVLTFDDASVGQFRLLEDATGERYADPTTAVGVMEAFFTEHPDVGRGGHFAFVPNNCFRADEEVTTCEERVAWLAEHGYEIGNHTWYHQNLGEADDERFMSQIGDTKLWIDEQVSGAANLSSVLTLPFGAFPATEWQYSMLVNGFDWEGQRIQMAAILMVGGGPSVSPDSALWDPWAITRFNTDPTTLGSWQEQVESGALTLYTSDGNPHSVTIPEKLPADLADQFDPEVLVSRGRSLLQYNLDPADEPADIGSRPDGLVPDRRWASARRNRRGYAPSSDPAFRRRTQARERGNG